MHAKRCDFQSTNPALASLHLQLVVSRSQYLQYSQARYFCHSSFSMSNNPPPRALLPPRVSFKSPLQGRQAQCSSVSVTAAVPSQLERVIIAAEAHQDQIRWQQWSSSWLRSEAQISRWRQRDSGEDALKFMWGLNGLISLPDCSHDVYSSRWEHCIHQSIAIQHISDLSLDNVIS